MCPLLVSPTQTMEHRFELVTPKWLTRDQCGVCSVEHDHTATVISREPALCKLHNHTTTHYIVLGDCCRTPCDSWSRTAAHCYLLTRSYFRQANVRLNSSLWWSYFWYWYRWRHLKYGFRAYGIQMHIHIVHAHNFVHPRFIWSK